MREVLIKAIPFDDLKITELEGVQQVNEHGELVFSGLMRGEKESEYISWALKKNPLVSVNVCSDSGEEKILFQGVLVDFEIQAQNDVRYLTGVLRTNTYLLDLIPHKRSFQADRLQYQNLLTTVNMAIPIPFSSWQRERAQIFLGLLCSMMKPTGHL